MKSLLGILLLVFAVVIPIASGYLAAATDKRFVLHRVVICFFVIRGLGEIFKILHWTGADQMLMLSYVGFGVGGFLLIWTGLRNPTQRILFYQLVCGILIALMTINFYYPIHALSSVLRFLTYPLAAFSLTIILNRLYVHLGEKNMVIMFSVTALWLVVLDLVRLF